MRKALGECGGKKIFDFQGKLWDLIFPFFCFRVVRFIDFIKILDWQFTIIKIEIEKLKFTIDDKCMAYV